MAIRNCFEREHSIMDTSFLRAMCDNIRDSGYFKIRAPEKFSSQYHGLQLLAIDNDEIL